MLKKIRVILAIIFFSLITFIFLDFADLLPKEFSVLAKIQFVPAALSLSWIILGIILLLTILFGRIYCSIICPLGVFQDISNWFSKKIIKKKKYNYRKQKTILRLVILGLVIISLFFIDTLFLEFLDPYSAYGRIIYNVFKPIYVAGNNLLETIFTNFGIYTFYKEPIFIASIFAFITGIITFLTIGFLSFFYGRTWCNTICPVGTILGFLNKISILKIRINEEKCNKCSLCAKKCKAFCINPKESKIDHSRCVNCFNCINVCKQNAISYNFKNTSKKLMEENTPQNVENENINTNLRNFLVTIGLAGISIPKTFANKKLVNVVNQIDNKKEYNLLQPITPPGSRSIEHFNKKCTSCHLCVSKCPQKVLKPAFKEYGIEGIMQPVMKFDKGFCNFDCTLCSEVCPNGAIKKITKEEKHLTQVGKVVFILENCVVYTNGTSCGACSEHCPTQAVKMKPYKDGLTIPTINKDICVGCGGCEYICPVRPFRAIHVEANAVQVQAKPIEKEKQDNKIIDDFGF
ncbi:MAG: 4Fe-4S binding protein [Bacteroidales bacterium]|jgi:polyferredoxin|nr:4Fe-4S binding protein [Bacteroidales bacterium]